MTTGGLRPLSRESPARQGTGEGPETRGRPSRSADLFEGILMAKGKFLVLFVPAIEMDINRRNC